MHHINLDEKPNSCHDGKAWWKEKLCLTICTMWLWEQGTGWTCWKAWWRLESYFRFVKLLEFWVIFRSGRKKSNFSCFPKIEIWLLFLVSVSLLDQDHQDWRGVEQVRTYARSSSSNLLWTQHFNDDVMYFARKSKAQDANNSKKNKPSATTS